MGVLGNGSSGRVQLDIAEANQLPEIRKKQEQKRGAAERFNACDAKIARVKANQATPVAPIGERAAASLRGETISTSGPKEDLNALYEERQVLFAALSMASDELDEAISLESLKVCEKFSPEHQARVKELAIRAIAFHEAEAALGDLSRQIIAKGFKLTGAIEQFPRLCATLGRPSDQNSPLAVFLGALRSRGLEV
jgi:hypothetical protein